MALGVERYGSRADTGAFIACLLLSLILLALPEGLRAPIAATLRRTVLAPALAVQRRSAVSSENRANLDALRAQRDSLALGAALVPELAAENARLRGLMGLGERLGSGFVTAEVLHQAGVGDGMTLVLSTGRADGVEPLAPVVAPEGLVGMVRSVDAHTSIALAWTHPDFRASAMIESKHVYGIVVARRGERAGDLMELQGIAFREALTPGTPVVTSGLGGVFPRGVPIGTVQGVLSESAGWERTYILRPAVHPAQVTHVMILTAMAEDLTAEFADTAHANTAVHPPRAARRP
ncbi:MAG: rod shape-determining protein MreC [Gemmatimonadales bacterium]